MPEKVVVTREKLDSLAEVIGAKSGSGIPLTFDGMEDAVLGIETGIEPSGTLSITSNGAHDVTQYANADVNVRPRLQTKECRPTTYDQFIHADVGYDGLFEVRVDQMYLGPKGVAPTTEQQIISAEPYDGLSEVIVGPAPLFEVSVTPSTETQVINGSVVRPDTHVAERHHGESYRSKSALTEGLLDVSTSSIARFHLGAQPRYVQGSVTVAKVNRTGSRTFTFSGDVSSNNTTLDPINIEDDGDITGIGIMHVWFSWAMTDTYEIRIAPKNNSGWSSDGQYFSTVNIDAYEYVDYYGISKVTVNPIPSEYIIPSGSQQLTQNGTYNVTELASVDVDIPEPSGSQLLTQNGTYDVTDLASVQVNVPKGIIQDQDGFLVLDDDGDGNDIAVFKSIVERTATNLTLPDCITLIGDSAFYQWTNLTSIVLPSGLTSIGNNAFMQCNNLASIVLPSGLTSIGNSAFQSCTNLVLTELPSGLTSIGNYAFYRCSKIALTKLPSGLTSIGNYAFMGCSNLALTELPSGLTSIGTYAFQGCTNLALTELPSGLTSIGSYAFQACANLVLTELPSGLTSIEGYAFSNCTKLTSIAFPSGLTSIGNYAFVYCTNLADIELPSGLTSIGSNAFQGCTNLALTELPSGLTSIGDHAFEYCIKITSISCEGSITKLGSNSFGSGSNYPMALTSVSFPNMALSSLTTVFGSSNATSACSQLEFCDIGSTRNLQQYSFGNCVKLQTLVLRSTTVCTLSSLYAFNNTPMRGYNNLTGTVYVPSSLIGSYKTATNWSTLYNNGTVTFVAIEGSEYER